MIRREGWEKELDKFLNEKHDKPFKRGQHDCVMFVCDAVEIITGVDFGEELRGKYKTKKEAFEHVKKAGCQDLIELTNKTLGQSNSCIPVFAGRGDVVAVKYGGELGLAIVDLTGRRAVTPGKKGLQYYSVDHWLKAWRV